MAGEQSRLRRNQSVYLVWIVSEPKPENARVRAGAAGLAVGALIYVRRQGESTWRAARRVEQPAGRQGYERVLWIDFDIDPR